MSSVDQRVVKMEFENDTFKRKAVETQKSLADVNKAVDNAGKSKGLLDLNSNMQKVSVTASKMTVATTAAIGTIASKVTTSFTSMLNSLTFDPIRQGFHEYEAMLTKQNVIQNATGKSAKTVKSILNQLNHYSDQTIYSFGNMTDAITKFVNAGVPLDKSVQSIKGIANAAAFAGASSEEANRAMYAFSQSMSLGFIGLQDWMQIENANMATVQFKQTLIDSAVEAGTLTKRGKEYLTTTGKVVTATKGWRDGLKEQWATTQVLNKALGKYADTSTELGKKAFDSATQVRTFSAFMDTLKESLGSGWSSVFTSLIGGLGGATKMWTSLSHTVGGATNGFFKYLSVTLRIWRNHEGLANTIKGFQNILAPVGALLRAVGDAWNEAFPRDRRAMGKGLAGLSAGFAAITSPLQLLAKLIYLIKAPLTVFFQIIRIGGTAINELVGYLADLVSHLFKIGEVKPPSGGLVDWAKKVGHEFAEAVRHISDLLDKGKSLGEAFGSVNIKLPTLPSIPSLPSIGSIFGGGNKDASSVEKISSGVKDLGKGLKTVNTQSSKLSKSLLFANGEKISKGWSDASDVVKTFGQDAESAGNNAGSILSRVGDILGNLLDKFLGFAEGFNFQTLVKSFNMALFATFTISIARLFNTFSKGFQGFAQLGGTFNEVLGNVGDSITGFAKAQQRQATAKLILNIAIALGILAVSLWILSKIPIDSLGKALGAMAASFTMFGIATKMLTGLFNAMDGKGLSAALNMTTVAFALIALAGAMVLMALAGLIMNRVKWSSVWKSVVLMGAMMVVLQNTSRVITGLEWVTMIAASVAIITISAAMVILAGALMLFDKVKPESMTKAGAALAAIVVSLTALGMLVQSKYGALALVAAGAAFTAVAASMVVLAGALKLFESVKWDSMKKAGVALAGMAVGMTMMVVGSASGPGLLIASVGLNALATALMLFGYVDWSAIPKMVVALGALALGLTILTPVLYIAAPALLLFGAAIALLGAGVLAFATAMAIAVGLAAVSVTALSALAIAAAVAIGVFFQTLAAQTPIVKESVLAILQAIVDTIVEGVPIVVDGIKRLWLAMQKEFDGPANKKGAKKSGESWVKQIADAIEDKLPEIVREASELILAFLAGLETKARDLGAAGARVVAKFIQGVADESDSIIKSGGNLIIKWIEGIGSMGTEIAIAALETVVTFLNDMARAISSRSGAVGSAISNLTEAMVGLGMDMVGGLAAGLVKGAAKYNPVSAVGGLVGKMVGAGRAAADSHSPSRKMIQLGMFMTEGLTIGIQKHASAAIRAVASLVTGQIAMANSYISKFVQKLDQQSIAAQAKAEGLAMAADRAQRSAQKTKSKKDDRRADALAARAEKAQDAADKQQAKAERATDRANRDREFAEASTIDKARMRSEDAQNAIDDAKEAEKRAAANRIAADALDRQARGKGVTKKQRKALRDRADELRQIAKMEAKNANASLERARTYAAQSLSLQTKAGKDAADAFEAQYKAEAQSDAEADAFEKMSNEEKAAKRRADAAKLQAQADKDLAAAKKLAYTDLDAANELAQKALDEADQAREYLKDAEQYAAQGGTAGSILELAPTEAAALAFNGYSQQYDAAVAAAARESKIEFNQYNTSPESLSDVDIYRNTNNQLAFATEQLAEVA